MLSLQKLVFSLVPQLEKAIFSACTSLSSALCPSLKKLSISACTSLSSALCPSLKKLSFQLAKACFEIFAFTGKKSVEKTMLEAVSSKSKNNF